MLRKYRRPIAYLFLLIGVIWFLQGINILPGSFMTGEIGWAAAGAVFLAVGIVLLQRPAGD
ncbi:MAG: hypothetical protein OEV06_01320 [Anaerolineae bacterium]|nr:hypothetical protein [Anaerolineae bacterium]